MKKKILALLVSAMIIFNVSYARAAGNEINQTVLQSFTSQFETATDVQWTKMATYYKASFTWNAQYLSAFYDEKGEQIAVSRNIQPKDLPFTLQAIVAEEYKGYWISELFEYTTKDSNKYYLTIESANKQIVLESVDNNYWSVFRKSTKE